jgi:hypothetical protein
MGHKKPGREPSASSPLYSALAVFSLKASVLLISNFVLGCKENNLSTFGFMMLWILSKLAITSGVLNGFNLGFLHNQNSFSVPFKPYLNLYFSISGLCALL